MKVRSFEPVSLFGASVAGAFLFLWPFFGLGLPPGMAAGAVAGGALIALFPIEVIARRLDARGMALLASLSAIDAGARAALVTGIGGFSPIFLLILCGGYAMGPVYGFLVGSLSLLLSALATGGLGPWLGYQIFAAGWVGSVAGAAGVWRRRKVSAARPTVADVVILCAVGLVCGYGYGAVMDLWQWTFFRSSSSLGFHAGMPPLMVLQRFLHFYVATSAVYDSFRAVGNVVLVAAVGLPVIMALLRLRSRFQFEVVPYPPERSISAARALSASETETS